MILIKNLKHIVILLTLVWQAHLSSAQDTIPLNSVHSFVAAYQPGYTYAWWYTNQFGLRTDFSSTSNKTEEILWETEGDYTLYSQAKDANNCLSEIISKPFVVKQENDTVPLTVLAGPDTTIGSCQSYIFADVYPVEDGFTYLWSPALYLDNPNIPNPVFTPGETTTYILTVTNSNGISGKDTVTISVNQEVKPVIEFGSSDVLVEQGTINTHELTLVTGNPKNAVYQWFVSPANGTTTDLSKIQGSAATILWDGPIGNYQLFAVVTTENGCTSDTAMLNIEIADPSDFFLTAGQDTTIGGCKPMQLQAVVAEETGVTYTYLWSPIAGLDNPAIANPVFTPGNTTTFVVTVNSSKGGVATDSVKVTVSAVFADAGNDVITPQGSTTLLDGSQSSGTSLAYNWTTNSGKIESGANSATPVVSGFGDYYLIVTDEFGCADRDTVNVTRLANAPVAVDDYDTTAYQREIVIDVLVNDTDLENSINPASLIISNSPLNGTAYVDFETYKVHYRPNTGFKGTDVFEYRICNTLSQCDEANVYVFVSDFEFLIPNAFSPNGDGVNDYFEILGIDYYENNSITIINRWGNKVYEAKNYGINTNPKFWDGKSDTGFSFGDDNLPTGTYFYILDLGNGEKPISGSIYLDR
jgi:gliding motility-associated-like protein